MEWPDFSLEDQETLHGLLSNIGGWTIEENNMFEKALAEIMPDSPAFFENVASRIPWKSIEDVQNHYQALLHDLDMIESGRFPVPNYKTAVDEQEKILDEMIHGEKKDEGSPSDEAKKGNGLQRRRGVPWTEEEHQLFLMGLNKYGKGDWRSISRYYVITKTPTQVASHAQKYFRRLTSSTPVDRRRPSIHDIQTVNPNTFAKSLPPQRQINYNCLPNVSESMLACFSTSVPLPFVREDGTFLSWLEDIVMVDGVLSSHEFGKNGRFRSTNLHSAPVS
ncbi:hypothetical protein DH2020_013692 [Rehmannia glutinosa]|uniref:Uncharacterized protein n=1 Tax=Rehmannia glutinosa TaxID=99300 RepID=A0ABR0X432_REHGL